ncbi:MAG: hypothetical protein GY930_05110 [bacterium]|nr:hypothetical protein [bacterium]
MAKSKLDKLAREVVDLTMQFHRARIWLQVSSDAIFRVRLVGGESVVCCILGNFDADLGLLAAFGKNAQEAIELDFLEGTPYEPQEGLEVVQVHFTAFANIPDESRRIFSQAGKSFSRGAAAPWMTGCEENRTVRPIGRAHMRIMREVLRIVLAAHAQGQLHPCELGAKRRMSEYRLEGFGKKAKVHETVVTVPTVDRIAAAGSAPPNLRVIQSARGMTPGGQTWAIGSQPLPQFEGGEYAEIVLGIDLATGQMLPPGVLAMGDPDAEFDRTLPGLFAFWFALDGIQIPERILFESYGHMRQLGGTLNTLGIPFSHEPDHPRFSEMLQDFAERAEPLAEACEQEFENDSPIQPDELERWKGLVDRISERVIRLMSPMEKVLRSHAFPRFFGNRNIGDILMGQHVDRGLGAAFIEWYLFHYRARATSKTVAEKCLAKAKTDTAETQLLQVRSKAPLAPYRVAEIDPGASLVLENLYSGEQTRIHDKALSETAREGTAFVARVFPAGAFHFTFPISPPTSPSQLLASLAKITPPDSEPFLPRGTRGLGLLWHQAPSDPPQLQNTDGDPLEELTLLYRADNPAQLAKQLGCLPGLDTEDANQWDWTRPHPEHPSLGSILIANMELIQDELLVHVNSANRACEAHELLDPIPGLTHIRTSPAVPSETPSHQPQPSPEEMELFTKAIHDRILAWVDEPVPALRNLTPKVAYQDPSMRDQVVQMIRTYPDSHSPWGVILAPRDELLRRVKQK